MRVLVALLIAISTYAQTAYQLDAGAEKMIITDAGTPMVLSLPLRGATSQIISIWGSYLPVRGTVQACPDPCTVALDRATYGTWQYYQERLDAEGNVISGPKVTQGIPQRVETETSYTVPIEVLGIPPMSRKVQVTTQANADATGQIRLYMVTHACGYVGKCRVRTNDGTRIDITKANVTLLRDAANWTFTTLDFGQRVLWMTVPIADPVVGGTNTVEFQFWNQRRKPTSGNTDNLSIESGFRVLEFSFLQPAKTCAQVVVSGSNVTMTCADHGYTTGDDILIEYPGVAWRVNGMKKNITVTGTDTFTFTISESDGKLPGTTTHAGVTASKSMIDMDTFVQEDPSTWTAPPGSNAGTGATLAAQTPIFAPEFPGHVITASCVSCHAAGLRDMKYFNYSNHSNIVRSLFHGMSIQQGKDIAAYVRSNASDAPGRPYIPPFQPCPNADVVDVQLWAGACSLDDILGYDMGMYEGLFGSSIEKADFLPTISDSFAWRNQRISFQLLSWNDWLPATHPQDTWKTNPGSNGYPYFPTSRPNLAYSQLRSGLTGKCPTPTCAAENSGGAIGYYAARWADMSGRLFTVWDAYGSSPLGPCVGGVPNSFTCSGVVTNTGNQLPQYGYSAAQWAATKTFEVVQEFDLARYGPDFYPSAGTARVIQWAAAFGQSPNLLQILKTNGVPGILDGTPATEKLVSMQWYQLAAILNPNTNIWQFDSITPLDVGYTHGYFKDLFYNAGMRLPFLTAQWVQQNFRRLRNRTPATDNAQSSWRGLDLINPSILTSPDYTPFYAGIPADIRTATVNALVDASYSQLFDIVGGATVNGTASAFTASQFPFRNTNWTNTNLGISAAENWGKMMWHALIYAKALGFTSSTMTDLANTYAPAIIIPSHPWSTARDFTGCVWNTTQLKVLTPGGGNCDGAAPAP